MIFKKISASLRSPCQIYLFKSKNTKKYQIANILTFILIFRETFFQNFVQSGFRPGPGSAKSIRVRVGFKIGASSNIRALILGPENESGSTFSKIDTGRSIYWFRSIDVSILEKNSNIYSHVAYHFGSIFGSRERIRHYIFENRYRSINISIFDRSMYRFWKKNPI